MDKLAQSGKRLQWMSLCGPVIVLFPLQVASVTEYGAFIKIPGTRKQGLSLRCCWYDGYENNSCIMKTLEIDVFLPCFCCFHLSDDNIFSVFFSSMFLLRPCTQKSYVSLSGGQTLRVGRRWRKSMGETHRERGKSGHQRNAGAVRVHLAFLIVWHSRR